MTIVKTEKAPVPAGTYSQAVEAGGLLFISGQICFKPNGEFCDDRSFEGETRQVFENLKAIAEEAGADLAKSVKLTVYLSNIGNMKSFNAVMGEYFTDNYPARVMVEVAKLPLDVQVEVDAIVKL